MYFDSLAGSDLIALLKSLVRYTSIEDMNLGVPLRHTCNEPEYNGRMMMGPVANSVYVWSTMDVSPSGRYDVIQPAYDARNIQIQLQRLFPGRSFPLAVLSHHLIMHTIIIVIQHAMYGVWCMYRYIQVLVAFNGPTRKFSPIGFNKHGHANDRVHK